VPAPRAGGGVASAWAPLRHPWYRRLWLAQMASNIGTWMQTVAAQWLMLSLTSAALPVALVQTAMSLPVLFVGLQAGALGDVVDRRHLLMAAQAFMLAAAATLAALTFAGMMSPWMLLAFTFAIGTGQALMAPAWMAIQPELVERDEIPQASALGAVNVNLARAVGPAVGGVVVAAAGPGAAFAANAASFVGALGVLSRWPRRPDPRPLGAEPLGAAIRAGLRYVSSSPPMRAVLARAGLFLAFAVALWALLPVLAAQQLHLGSAGYGLLLGLLGIGAVGGALLLPLASSRLTVDTVVGASTVAYGLGVAALALTGRVSLIAIVLPLVGAAWIGALSSINAAAQTLLPGWVRARAMAVYMLVFQGTQAIGSVVWGGLATRFGLRAALIVAAAGLIAGPIAALRYRLRLGHHHERTIIAYWPEPEAGPKAHPEAGPVLVLLEYRVQPAHAGEFERAMERVRAVRRRSGAQRWSLYHDATDHTRYVETFTVASWQEHLRQHSERLTKADLAIEETAWRYIQGEPRVSHLIATETD
jgi:MFS family permease